VSIVAAIDSLDDSSHPVVVCDHTYMHHEMEGRINMGMGYEGDDDDDDD